jgi:anti-anti-sigma factor
MEAVLTRVGKSAETRRYRELAVAGDLDIASSERVLDELTRGQGDPEKAPPVLILDLSGVTFCDSSGLRVLIVMWKRLRATGRRLVLAAPSGQVRRLLQRTGLDQRIEVHPTLPHARRQAA